MTIGIIGLGFVGGALLKSFQEKKICCTVYDKYKEIGTLENCLSTEILFLCLPTLFDFEKKMYDKMAILETCEYLMENNYAGIVVIKSTVEPMTTEKFSNLFPKLEFVHNPEFLTARTAYQDFHNQRHVVIGFPTNVSREKNQKIIEFYSKHYPSAEISVCTSTESESMKIFCNSFYAVKIQFFTELYELCQKMDCSFDNVKTLMLKNQWIHPMHTKIPGPDGSISYGGYCFPKDTTALLSFMEELDTHSAVLAATVEERNEMRQD
jgi:nucleotide sugar dehydrogenase